MTAKLALIGATLFATAHAGVIYNEAISGDLSGSGLTPTILTVALGSNQLLGTTGNTGVADRDYFTFTVPGGAQLTGITVLPGTTSGNISFLGMQAGNQVTLPTNTPTAAGLLGWRHYSPADINTDILPLMAVPASGSSGFTVPLGSGSYAFWLQDTSPGTFTYGFDFAVAAPEPESYTTVVPALGALLFILGRRRRTRSAGRG